MNKRSAYTVLQTETAEDGGYLACLVIENEPGYYSTACNWGADLDTALETARQRNESMGISPQEAAEILDSSGRAAARRSRFVWEPDDIVILNDEDEK